MSTEEIPAVAGHCTEHSRHEPLCTWCVRSDRDLAAARGDTLHGASSQHPEVVEERITTAGTLDALPVGSRYLDRFGDVGEIVAPGMVRYPETADLTTAYAARFLPGTVTYRPDAPVATPEADSSIGAAVLDAIRASAEYRMHEHWETTTDIEALRDALRWQGQVTKAQGQRLAALAAARTERTMTIEMTAENAETVLSGLDGDSLLMLSIATPDALWELLDDFNQHGYGPSIPIMDAASRWWMAYLHEVAEDTVLHLIADDPSDLTDGDGYVDAAPGDRATYPVRPLAGPWPN